MHAYMGYDPSIKFWKKDQLQYLSITSKMFYGRTGKVNVL